jgi:hypothetical protein
MKWLTNFKSFIFALFFTTIGVISWGQTPHLTVSSTEDNTYLISSVDDWNTFAADVNGGYSYSGKFVKLTSNIGTAEIPVTTMVGDLVDAVYYSFKGTFDGDDHTLTFHYNYTELQSSQRLNRVAPFRYINGATIKKLRVAGDINMDKPNAGGLFCVNDIYNDSRSNIIDCTVSVNITGYKDYCGGFAAVASNTTFTGCVYNGRLNIGRYSGGFSAQGNKKTIIDNCLCAPTAGSEIYSRSGNFVNEKNAVITNSYYTLLPNPDYSILTQGTRAYTSAPAVFTKKRQLIDGNYYYVEGNATIINLPDGYDYTGSVIPVTYGMTFKGTPLTETTDFIASFTPSPVKEKGVYTLTLSGNNSHNYYGSVSQTFTVIDGYLEGEGTAEDPYLIEDEHDWSVLTNKVDYGTGVDSYYKLTADLNIAEGEPINTIIGTTTHPFRGHFDGGWHTLTININRTGLIYAAPFGVVDGATIENLKVAGTIRTDNKFAGGILGWVNNTDDTRETHINNCISVVNIESSTNGDGSHGGFAGQVEKGLLRFENCAFEGSITGDLTDKCAGFVSWRQGQVEYNNCTMAGTISIHNNPSIADNTANFHRNGEGTFTNAYYITPSAQLATQGTEITSSATAPTNGLYRKYTVSANNYYVPSVTISELDNSTTTIFSYTGSVIPVNPVVTNYGWTLAKGTDYTVDLTYSSTESGAYGTVSEIKNAGYYKMTVTGITKYGGSKVYNIRVVDINSWSVLKDALTGVSGTVTVYNDLSAASDDGALVVSGNMVLDLNGHTLNRNRTAEEANGYVIKVENGASLKIINGTLTGGWNSESGGGIYSEGDLTLIGADVVNNKCRELGGGIYCHGGTFYMTDGGVIRNETTHDNLTTAGGGGIHADGVTAFKMNNVIVTENKTVSKGGGIRFHIGAIKAYINNCTITKNESKTNPQSKGGGIYFETTDKGSLDVTGGLICVNSVSAEGGGVYVIHGVVSIKDCQILGNVSGNIGGAISAYNGGGKHSKIILNGCGINGNTSTNRGGGVYLHDGAEIEIQGELRIIGNESTSTESNNLYLADSDGVIAVTGSLPGAVIGVSRSGAGTLTSGLAGNGTVGNFISDCGTRVVLPVGGEAYLQNYYIWGVTEGWPDLPGIAKDGDDYTFNAIVIIPNGTTVTPSKLVVRSGGLVVADGGQLVYTNTSFHVSAKVQRNIEAAESKDDVYGWYTIASPVNDAVISTNTTLKTTNSEPYDYDLMMYDEPNHYWRSYRSETASTYFEDDKMVNGLGYLYRNANNVTVEFTGPIHSGDVTCSVTNSGDLLPGFNLIGNPFTHDITFGNISLSAGSALTGGYVLNKAGSWGAILAANTSIKPCQGVLVQVSESATATISHTARARKASDDFISFAVANSQYEDVAFALFGEGSGLSKIDHQNPDIPMIYIHQDDEDYAIATMEDDTKTFNLDFVAKTTGNYTLSVKPEGKFSYIHVIDKVTGEEIDMLREKEYSFIASVTDDADRFIVCLEHFDDADGTVFAYQSGTDIVVVGEGELQVFDVMGRLVAKQYVNGVETWRAASVQTGVYIFRLEGKTQKMVVR